MSEREGSDGRPSFTPEEGLEVSKATAEDSVPLRGLVADLDDAAPEVPEIDDTASDGVPVLDHTMPISGEALAALLAEEIAPPDASTAEEPVLELDEVVEPGPDDDTGGADVAPGDGRSPGGPEREQTAEGGPGLAEPELGEVDDPELEETGPAPVPIGDSTEVDLSAAAQAVAAELMGPAGTPELKPSRAPKPKPKPARAPPPPPATSEPTPIAPVSHVAVRSPVVPPAPPSTPARPLPRAPSLSLPPADPVAPEPSLEDVDDAASEPVAAHEISPTVALPPVSAPPVHPMAKALTDPPSEVGPRLLILAGLAIVPFLIFVVWWLG